MTTTYRTKDVALAGFLLTYGYKLLEADKKDPANVAFVFEHVEVLPPLETVIAGYHNDQAVVEPKLYYRNTKLLKTIIYGGYKPTSFTKK